jgi:hypothetical protein
MIRRIMKARVLRCVAAFFLALVSLIQPHPAVSQVPTPKRAEEPKAQTGSALAFGQIASQAIPSEVVPIDAPRPLWEISERLQDGFGWQVTYEENAYDRETQVVSSAEDQKLLAPRSKPIAFRLDLAKLSKPGEVIAAERQAVVQDLVRQYEERDTPARFAVIQEGEYTHIISSGVVTRGRKMVGYEPVLDAVVSPQVKGRSMLQEVNDLVVQLSAARGVSVQLGNFPTNMFLQQKALFEVRGPIQARQALIGLLAQAGLRMRGGRPRFAWSLIFDPNSNGYFLNITEVMPRGPAIWQTAPQPATPADQRKQDGHSKIGAQRQP